MIKCNLENTTKQSIWWAVENDQQKWCWWWWWWIRFFFFCRNNQNIHSDSVVWNFVTKFHFFLSLLYSSHHVKQKKQDSLMMISSFYSSSIFRNTNLFNTMHIQHQLVEKKEKEHFLWAHHHNWSNLIQMIFHVIKK